MIMERLKTTQEKTDKKFTTLSKYQFKRLIDKIQKSMKPTKSSNSNINNSSINNYQLNTAQRLNKRLIVTKQIKQSINSYKNIFVENRASICLQFNKLLLNQKTKFNQHKPNQKDLILYLPELKDKQFKKQRNHQFSTDKNCRIKWKNNKLINQKHSNLNKQNQIFRKLNVYEAIKEERHKSNKKQKQPQHKNNSKSLLNINLKNFVQSFQKPRCLQKVQYDSSNISRRFNQIKIKNQQPSTRHTVKVRKFSRNQQKNAHISFYKHKQNTHTQQNNNKKNILVQKISQDRRNTQFQMDF